MTILDLVSYVHGFVNVYIIVATSGRKHPYYGKSTILNMNLLDLIMKCGGMGIRKIRLILHMSLRR